MIAAAGGNTVNIYQSPAGPVEQLAGPAPVEPIGSATRLQQIWLEIVGLRQQLARLRTDMPANTDTAKSDGFAVVDLEGARICDSASVCGEIGDREDNIRAQLYDLAWRIVDTPAQNQEDIVLKARVISDRHNDGQCDIVAALAYSISHDILVLAAR